MGDILCDISKGKAADGACHLGDTIAVTVLAQSWPKNAYYVLDFCVSL